LYIMPCGDGGGFVCISWKISVVDAICRIV
jgi:hypothetical protein